MCGQEERLGRNGIEEIQAHPFFEGIDWDHLQETQPPWEPPLKGATDTSHFAKFAPLEEAPAQARPKSSRKDKNWIGYTYTSFPQGQL